MNNTYSDAAMRTLAEQTAEFLKQHNDLLVVAESCTGGWLGKVMTDIPGSSAFFDGGMMSYSYEAKQALLGVRQQTLTEYGAVSEECVLEMVAGALINLGGSLAVAVTGIAGPSGGTEDKPVGTVWIAWKKRGGYPLAKCFHFSGDRDSIRRQTVCEALKGIPIFPSAAK